MTRTKLAAGLVGLALAVAACDSSGNLSGGIGSLGASFVRAFNADPNSEPVNAQDVALTMTPTIEPFDPS